MSRGRDYSEHRNFAITPGADLDTQSILKGIKNGPICICEDGNSDLGLPDAARNYPGNVCFLQLPCQIPLFDQNTGARVHVGECTVFELLTG